MNTLSPRQAAAELGCSLSLVYDLFKDGELRGYRVRTNIRIYPESLTEYVKRNENGPPTQAVIQQGELPARKRTVRPPDDLIVTCWPEH